MLKLLLGGVLLLLSLAASAQSVTTPPAGRFCVVRGLGLLDDNRPDFTLDYGLALKNAKPPEVEQVVLSFKQAALHSTADMLNYMDRTGWELVQTTAAVATRPLGTTSFIEYQYIFRRKAN